MSRLIVLDTNCLVQIISAHSPYRDIWLAFLQNAICCVSVMKYWDNNKFVDCAIIAGADYIVSEDSHFHVLEHIPFPTVKVIRLDEFQRTLKC